MLIPAGQRARSYVLPRAIVNVDQQKYWNINYITWITTLESTAEGLIQNPEGSTLYINQISSLISTYRYV